MTKKIYKLEKPLLNQLNNGKEAFKKDLDKFEDDFVKSGPMVRGISAAEASKRVSTSEYFKIETKFFQVLTENIHEKLGH